MPHKVTDKKLKIGLVYQQNLHWLSGKNYDNNAYNFLLKALPRHPEVDLTIINTTLDLWRRLETEDFDALVFFHAHGGGYPYGLENLKEIKTPKILMCGDTHDAIKICEYYNMRFDDLALHFGFDALFYQLDKFYTEQFYPNEKFNYWQINYGIEKEDYKIISEFKPRIKNKILCTGALAGPTYILRKKCSKLKSIDYWSTKAKRNKTKQTFTGNNYPKLLQKYRASIAATTICATNKYLELPAAGCLTFMEVTEQNHADLLGFEDGVNAIFINEENYKQKFDEYLKDPDNPKWEKIAKAGREFVMNNYTNDHCVDKLIQNIKQFIKDNPREKKQIKYPSFPGENCIKTFVLTLKRSTDRQKAIKKNLEEIKLNYEFFYAIDGKQDQHPDFKLYDPESAKLKRRPGLSRTEAACFISHKRLWEKCVELNEPILVLEDDAIINDDLILLLPWLKERVKTYGFIKLYGHPSKYKQHVLEKSGCYETIKSDKGTLSTVAYLLAPKAAQCFLDNTKKIDIPVDNYMDKSWKHKVEHISIYPFPVSTPDNEDAQSTIEWNDPQPPKNMMDKLKKFTANTIEDIQRRLHNRKFHQSLSKDKPDE